MGWNAGADLLAFVEWQRLALGARTLRRTVELYRRASSFVCAATGSDAAVGGSGELQNALVSTRPTARRIRHQPGTRRRTEACAGRQQNAKGDVLRHLQTSRQIRWRLWRVLWRALDQTQLSEQVR